MYEGMTMRRVMTHTRSSDRRFDFYEITPISNPLRRFKPFSDAFDRSQIDPEDSPRENQKTKPLNLFIQRRMK
jgi:hypothetical protein